MKIGIVTVDGDLREVLKAAALEGNDDAITADGLSQALDAGADLVFVEGSAGRGLPDLLEGLRVAGLTGRRVPVIVLAPAGAVTLMRRARASGAADVLFTPLDPAEIRAEIDDVKAVNNLDMAYQERLRELRRKSLVGESPNFIRCLEELKSAAGCDANVLLVGETGTGKEMFAQAIHYLSRRSGNPSVAVNCAGLPGTLLETELFGHVKGAFTGAAANRVGRFEAAGAGTLLLDEIGDVETPLQVKLLRVIEQRVFQRVGENRDAQFNARLICATSTDLEKAVAEGRFRRDLLGRIDQLRIELPPLRERRGDISTLAKHFLRKHSRGRVVEVSRSAMEALENYDYPMNIRQLENAIVGALARSDSGRLILPKHLPAEIIGGALKHEEPGLVISVPKNLPYTRARDYADEAVDKVYLIELLRKHGGNKTRAAEEAGIDRKTFADRVEQALQAGEGKSDD